MPKNSTKTPRAPRGPTFLWTQELAADACKRKKAGESNEAIGKALGAKTQSVATLFANLRKKGVDIPKTTRGPALDIAQLKMLFTPTEK